MFQALLPLAFMPEPQATARPRIAARLASGLASGLTNSLKNGLMDGLMDGPTSVFKNGPTTVPTNVPTNGLANARLHDPVNDVADGGAEGLGGGLGPQRGRRGVAGAANHAPAPASQEADAHAQAGFEIGWDHARLGLTPPMAQLGERSPVRRGWQAGRRVWPARRAPRPGAQAWCALRLQAWEEGAAFETHALTPAWLARAQAAGGDALQRPGAAPKPLRWVRLNPEAGYAVGNLALLGQDAAQASEGLGFEARWRLAQELAAEGPSASRRGLDAAAWERLAILASFATPLAHSAAACLPLSLLPPPRVRVINPVQALQVALTLQFSAEGWAPRIAAWAQAMPNDEARATFQIFMNTLMSRRVAVPPEADAARLREALEQAWREPLLLKRWQRLAMRLNEADIERLLRHAQRRGLMVGGGHWLPRAAATEGWALAEAA